jgi:hypothetical protein
MIAESAAEIQTARLMTLDAARVMDSGSEAPVDIGLIKLHGAKMLHNVIDRAIQVHGALGTTGDTPLNRMSREARYASTTGPTRCITWWWQGACSGTTRIARRDREVGAPPDHQRSRSASTARSSSVRRTGPKPYFSAFSASSRVAQFWQLTLSCHQSGDLPS